MVSLHIGPAEPVVPSALLLPAEREEQDIRLGLWSLRLTAGRLDDLRYGSARILRGVRFVVRDRDWGTFETVRSTAVASAGGLLVEGESSDGTGRVHWTLRVSVEAGELTVALEAIAASDFLRNRLGLVVLHHPEAAGAALEVRHPEGGVEQTAFPERIAPHQPARDIAGLAWVADGVPVRLAFDGDLFEMEDQRNWTDASFKTYSTPLALPFPVEIARGETIRQSVRIACTGPVPAVPVPTSSGAASIRTGEALHPLPEIRTAASTAPSAERPASRTALGLLVEVDVRWRGWRRALRRALEDAEGRPIDLRVIASSAGEIRTVLAEVAGAPLARLGAFAATGHRSEPELFEEVRLLAAERGIEAIGGVRSHFTELNRGAEALAAVDGALAFSVTPFMHDRSAHQLVDSLEVQRTLVRDARVIAAGRRLHLGPVTLRPRMNAVSTSPFDPGRVDIDRAGYGSQTVPGATDARQATDALAAWVVGSLDALAGETVDSLAYFEQWGPRGITMLDGPTAAGRVLEWAAELSGSPRLDVDVPGLVAVGALLAGERVVLLGNLGGRAVEVVADDVLEWRRASGGGPVDGVLRLLPGDAVRIILRDQPSSA